MRILMMYSPLALVDGAKETAYITTLIKGKNQKFITCKVDYHTTKTAEIKKKVILLCNASPECQCSAV